MLIPGAVRAIAVANLWMLAVTCASAAEVRWNAYPGFIDPGGQGMVFADLDGDGVDEVVLAGATQTYHPGFTERSQLLAVLGSAPAGFDVTRIHTLEVDENILGRIQVIRRKGVGDQILLAQNNPYGAESGVTRVVTLATPSLDVVSTLRLQGRFQLHGVGDVDADGEPEFYGVQELSLAPLHQARIYDLASGRQEWDGELYGSQALTVSAAQLDSDPALELVLTGAPGRVVDGGNHLIEWTYPSGFFGTVLFGNFLGSVDTTEFAVVERWGMTEVFTSKPHYGQVAEHPSEEVAIAHAFDVNGDGIDEIVVGRRQENHIIAFSPDTWEEIDRFDEDIDGGISDFGYGDVDGDGKPELINGAGTHSSSLDRLRVIDAETKQHRFTRSDVYGPFSSAIGADLDGDGHVEQIHVTGATDAAWSGPELIVRSAETGAEARRVRLWDGGTYDANAPVLIAGNIDADPELELLVAIAYSEEIAVVALDGISLDPIWTAQFLIGPRFHPSMAGLALVHADRNGPVRIAISHGSAFALLDAGGNLLWEIDTNLQGNLPSLLVADFDGDGDAEVSFGTDRGVRIIDLQARQVEQTLSFEFDVLHQSVESNNGCVHVVYGSGGLVRRDCTGEVFSSRTYGVEATFVRPVANSFGPLLLSDGDGLYLQSFGPPARQLLANLGPMFGAYNRGSLQVEGASVDLYSGAAHGVSRITLEIEAVFNDGFDR